MIKTLLLLSIFTLSAYSQCKIESFGVIIKFNKILDNSVISKSNCSDKANGAFISFISNIDGDIPSQQLENIFKSEHKLNIKFKPNKIKVISANDFIEENLSLKNIYVKDVHSLYGNASLNTNKKNSLKVVCSNCDSPGEKNVKLIHQSEQIWLSAEFLIKRRAFSLKSDISPFKDLLGKSLVEEVSILDAGNDQLFSDYENIKFYRANKNLRKGQVLKQNDLSPKTLVQYNQNVEVTIRGDKVALKSQALSRQSGKLGDVINLYNPKTKKMIKAKVIDFNKVLIEL